MTKAIAFTKNLITNMILALFIVWAVNAAPVYLSSREAFFTYYSVEPVSEEMKSSEGLWFVSDSVIKRELDMHWEDTLYCFNEDSSVFYSQYISQKTNVEPTERGKKTWQYNANIPDEGQCFLVSNITADVGHGETKEQSVTSSEFKLYE